MRAIEIIQVILIAHGVHFTRTGKGQAADGHEIRPCSQIVGLVTENRNSRGIPPDSVKYPLLKWSIEGILALLLAAGGIIARPENKITVSVFF